MRQRAKNPTLQRTPRLRKETIRKLAERTLTADALQQVAGGGNSWQPRYSQNCG